MKSFNLLVEKPRILDSSEFKHTATSWEIRSTPSADSTTNIIHHSYVNATNLYQYRITLDVDNSDVVYVRTKFHFGNGTESKWSNLMSIKCEQKGYKISNVVIGTPAVYYKCILESNNVNKLKLSTSKMALFSGFGKHISTSWMITDPDGKVIWQRLNDTDNLTEIILDLDMFELDRSYVFMAKHHTDTNGESRFGKCIAWTADDAHGNGIQSLFDIILLTPPIINRTMYAEVILKTTEFKTADLKLCNKNGNIIIEAYDQPTIRPTMFITASEDGVVSRQTITHPYVAPREKDVAISDPTEYQYIVIPDGSTVRWVDTYGKLKEVSGPAYIACRNTAIDTPELRDGNYGQLYMLDNDTKNVIKMGSTTDLQNAGLQAVSDFNTAKVGENIKVWGRIKLKDGTISEWKLLYDGPLLQAYIVYVDKDYEYLSKYSYAGDIMLNGYCVQTIRECGNDIILFTKYKDNTVYIGKIWQNKLIEVGEAFKLPEDNEVTISYLNVIPTYTDDLFINYMTTTTKKPDAGTELQQGPTYNNDYRTRG